jgi:hypothetical protein
MRRAVLPMYSLQDAACSGGLLPLNCEGQQQEGRPAMHQAGTCEICLLWVPR